ncbi:Putative Flp pilus-assembly TadE/G-like [Faunimonas pinastri]|uniref:Putative Flp pilus-assembly TadE/G-like n=1 Tax=Faunimonas pinastri TaxID=1855383 RepID=A0A1H9AAA8_9HYPH|nr:TadE/TadG family type IV pilus assembly protein [Faunimonas pinastri]SEP73565.1 Putative Flp pilus-assembly TadE/G-like [Faunimonas pinastri]
MTSAILRSLRRFGLDTAGNAALIFALAAVPLIGAAGFAIDYTQASGVRAQLQSIADAAALAGATRDSTLSATAATDYFNGAIGRLSLSPTPTPTVKADTSSDYVTVSTSYSMSGGISSIIGQKFPVAVTATAYRGDLVRRVSMDLNSVNMDASDTNRIYSFNLTSDGSYPDYDSTNKRPYLYDANGKKTTDGSGIPNPDDYQEVLTTSSTDRNGTTDSQYDSTVDALKNGTAIPFNTTDADGQVGMLFVNVQGNYTKGSGKSKTTSGTTSYFFSVTNPASGFSNPENVSSDPDGSNPAGSSSSISSYVSCSYTASSKTWTCTGSGLSKTSASKIASYASSHTNCGAAKTSSSSSTTCTGRRNNNCTTTTTYTANLSCTVKQDFPSCVSSTVTQYWDDNGGATDDNDYNDMSYSFSCPDDARNTSTVRLTN